LSADVTLSKRGLLDLLKDETEKFQNIDNKSIVNTNEYPTLLSSRSDLDALEKVFDHIFKQENK